MLSAGSPSASARAQAAAGDARGMLAADCKFLLAPSRSPRAQADPQPSSNLRFSPSTPSSARLHFGQLGQQRANFTFLAVVHLV